MGKVSHRLYINYFKIRVSDKLGKDRFGLTIYNRGYFLFCNVLYELGLDTECRKVAEKVDSAAEKTCAAYYLVPCFKNVQKRHRYCCHA